MKTVETTAIVTADGKLAMQVPPDIPPGEHQVVLVIDEKLVQPAKEKRSPLNFPAHNCGPWPENFSLRREDMYDDWGR